MSKSKSERMSKGAVVDQLCTMFGLGDNYEQLEPILRQVMDAMNKPPLGIMIAWKPEAPGSVSFNLLGMTGRTPLELQTVSEICQMVAQELGRRALSFAMSKEESNGRPGIGEPIDEAGDES